MINPIEHSRTREECHKYKVEPYVISADIYGQSNLAGRGGWTWYTGSASWMFIAGIKYILGLNIKNGYLSIIPHIPQNWTNYEIKYKYKNSIYNIKITRENNNTVTNYLNNMKFICNGIEIEDKKIKLEENGIYNIEITL